ncbi:MAG TPA: glycosyltransferase family 2 protein [Acidiferrobacter sp.]|nr:glycosyltransferase family 2 protein [Acidiferrobacter sp.]
MTVYTVRHIIFTMNRLLNEQKLYYQDIMDSDLPFVSVLVPMHNEEKTANQVLSMLMLSDYPMDRMEIIPVNDNSSDRTKEILDSYSSAHPTTIKPVHRDSSSKRGKVPALNEALEIAEGSIVLVFDSDYLPTKGMVRALAMGFKNPRVGSVMGRVMLINTGTNLLTRILDLERTGGYQVDQQARYNLGLIAQYGGTVGGFRKDLVLSLGGFDEAVLAEDTDLTFNLVIRGWEVAYANRLECYEEAPEEWSVRARQITRWSRGHNMVLFKYLFPLIRTKYLKFWQKLDGALLLFTYLVPFIFLIAIADSLALFFLGAMNLVNYVIIYILVGIYVLFGSFSPFYQIGAGVYLDRTSYRVRLLPFFFLVFIFNMWHISYGFIESLIDLISGRDVNWIKTQRYRTTEATEVDET